MLLSDVDPVQALLSQAALLRESLVKIEFVQWMDLSTQTTRYRCPACGKDVDRYAPRSGPGAHNPKCTTAHALYGVEKP